MLTEVRECLGVYCFEGDTIVIRVIQDVAGLSRGASHRPYSHHTTGWFALLLWFLASI